MNTLPKGMKLKKTIKTTLQIAINIVKQNFEDMKIHLESGIQRVPRKMGKAR